LKNVILLTIDTLRRDVLGCYGHSPSLTPFIDSLQTKCIRFNNAQTVGPYTQAAFPGILTSSYYLEYGYGKDKKKLSPHRKMVSEVLLENGIITAGFHSNAYLCAFFGWNRGWDTFYDGMDVEVSDKVPYIEAPNLNKKVLNWLAMQSMDKPFFLWVHYMDVHEPYIPQQKYLEMIDPDMDLDENIMFSLFKNVLLKRDVSNENTVATLKKLYLAGVRRIDDYINEFFSILERVNLLENSTIIVTADHGDEFNEHGGLSHDGKMYKELIDVPLLMFDSSLPKGQVSDNLVSLIDVSPTIIHLFGLKPVDHFEGHSLLPLDQYPDRGVLGEAVDKHGSKEKGDEKEIHFFRKGNMKIIYHERQDSWELYDLSNDPKELNNIIENYPDSEDLKNAIIPRVRRWQNNH
jgi:arylsulfatase A-like enzyme